MMQARFSAILIAAAVVLACSTTTDPGKPGVNYFTWVGRWCAASDNGSSNTANWTVTDLRINSATSTTASGTLIFEANTSTKYDTLQLNGTAFNNDSLVFNIPRWRADTGQRVLRIGYDGTHGFAHADGVVHNRGPHSFGDEPLSFTYLTATDVQSICVTRLP